MNYPSAFIPSLIVQHTGQRYPLGQATVTIGGAADNRIILSDPNVSPHHTAISWQSGTYVVQDLGSTDGTYVNDWRISSPQPLYDGDVIRIGDTSLAVQLAPAVAGAAPPPTMGFPAGGAAQAAAPVASGPYARSYQAPPAAAARRAFSPMLGGLLLLGLVLIILIVGGLYAVLGGGRSRPVVSIQSPADNAQILAGEQFLIQATATGARDASSESRNECDSCDPSRSSCMKTATAC